jgi:hypothetical protein
MAPAVPPESGGHDGGDRRGGSCPNGPRGPGPPKRLVALLDGGSVGDFEDAMPQLIARGSTARPPD